MANEKEVIEVVETLLNAFPHYKPRNIDNLIDLWARKFKDAEPEVLHKAADMHIDAEKWFPSIHEIRELVVNKKALYAIIQEEADKVDSLGAMLVELFRRFTYENEIDPDKFEKLARSFERSHRPHMAEATRERLRRCEEMGLREEAQ